MSMLIFKPAANLTFETVEPERQRLTADLKNHSVPYSLCRLDLSCVTRCDSSGLSLLIEAKRLCNQRKIELEVHEMPDFMRFLAKFLDIDSFFRTQSK